MASDKIVGYKMVEYENVGDEMSGIQNRSVVYFAKNTKVTCMADDVMLAQNSDVA